MGYDLSPFAVFVSNVKIRDYAARRLEELRQELVRAIQKTTFTPANGEFPELVRKALPPGILGTFAGVDSAIANLRCGPKYKDFFRLALLSIIPRYSRAVASGGWLKWIVNRTKKTSIATAFARRVELMIDDVRDGGTSEDTNSKARKGDARKLPESDGQFSAVITSPPYPNRHDYTRVFGVELMFGFLNWEKTRELRYQTIHSHPEARPHRPKFDDYVVPEGLENVLSEMEAAKLDPKILRMLRGYFIDMHICLRECQRVVKPGGKIAFVVGNAQYRGIALFVDELIAGIGAAIGLEAEKILAVRFRGNSAQQMGEFGRSPSRESVVIFKKTRSPE